MKTGAQIVKVDNIQPAKKEGFSSVRLRVTETKKDVKSILLGGKGFDSHLIAFQTISNEQVKALALKEGSDIGAAMGTDLRLTVTEITEAQFKALPVDRESGKGWKCQKAFQAKLIPADASKGRPNDVMITSGGSQVYRNVQLTEATEVDTLLKSDNVLSATEEVAIASASGLAE